MEPYDFSKPDGCEDHDRDAVRLRRWVESQLLEVFERYGYDHVWVPTIEYVDLYHQERIGHELFHHLVIAKITQPALFPAYGLSETACDTDELAPEDKNEVVLRPDLTAPVARMFVCQLLRDGKPPYLPVRLAYAGQVFRDREPAGLRLREFRQIGVELIGSNSPWADLELLCLACDCATTLGLSRWQLHIGHARLYKAILRSFGLRGDTLDAIMPGLELAARIRFMVRAEDTQFMRYVNGLWPELRQQLGTGHSLPEEPESLNADEWRRELPAHHRLCLHRFWEKDLRLPRAQLSKILELVALSCDPETFFREIEPYQKTAEVARLAAALHWLCTELQRRRNVPLLLTPASSRGIAYYTGVTFELHSFDTGSRYTDLCGGGRYDTLHKWIYTRARQTQQARTRKVAPPMSSVERFLTGVGLAFGVERVIAALANAGLPLSRLPRVFVAVQDEQLVEQAFAFADRLRQHGLGVECHLPLTNAAAPIREQIGHASHSAYRFTAIFGMDEWREQKIALRDMESREQWTITPQTAEKLLAELLQQERTKV